MRNRLYKLAVLSVVCAFGTHNSNADTVQDMIISAKEKLNAMAVEQTKISMNLAKQEQKLKQLEANAMMDTQNYMSPIGEKKEQISEVMQKLSSIEKEQGALTKQMQELADEIRVAMDKQNSEVK